MILNVEEWNVLMHNLTHTNEEPVRCRNAFFEKCNELEIEHMDGYIVISSPDIDEELILSKLET